MHSPVSDSRAFGRPGERAADVLDTFIADLGLPRMLEAAGRRVRREALGA